MNSSQLDVNNSTELAPAASQKHTPALYGLLALFWFMYIFLLYKICRCYVKDMRRKEELAHMLRLKQDAARINGQSLARPSPPPAVPSPPPTNQSDDNRLVIPDIKIELVDSTEDIECHM